LLDETRRFLLTYGQLQDLGATRQSLISGGLAQQARAARETAVKVIQQRLVRWNPPGWVLDDLVAFAQDPLLDNLRAALLLHVPRQDALLYDVVQRVIGPRRQAGESDVVRADVQRFLDAAQPAHREIDKWSHATREKLAGNLLSILRDYGLLQGTARKRIVEPVVPAPVVAHLVRLLRAEGVPPAELTQHPDWRLWLWEPARAAAALGALEVREAT
jgi:hypothetical protein